MSRLRALILATPLGASNAPNGSVIAVRELAEALAARDDVTPIVLAERGAALPSGVEACFVDRTRITSFFRAIASTRAEVAHAVFAPRRRTAVGLRAIGALLRAPVVQTIASEPRAWSRSSLVGDRVVATSASARRSIEARGLARDRLVEIPMPFSPPSLALPTLEGGPIRLLYVGDVEHGDAIEPTLRAFAAMTTPHGLDVELVIAARDKSAAAVAIKRRLLARIALDSALNRRVRWIGEVPSLLPWIASSNAVLLPASSTYAKLDHPRVLLEAIALGTPIVVGRAQSLAELVTSPSIGRIVVDDRSLREAMEDALDASTIDAQAAIALLTPRAPATVAATYAALYAAIRRA
ncbi:MAG: glycosyltransferase family 4 protein [Polyangiales bacterium]